MKVGYILITAVLLLTAACSTSSGNDAANLQGSMQVQLDAGWSAYSSGKPGFGEASPCR